MSREDFAAGFLCTAEGYNGEYLRPELKLDDVIDKEYSCWMNSNPAEYRGHTTYGKCSCNRKEGKSKGQALSEASSKTNK